VKFRTWLQGAGVAILILFIFCRGLLDRPGFRRMHSPESVASLAISLSINLVLVSVIFAALGFTLRENRWKNIRLFIPPIVLAALAETIYVAATGWVSTRLWILVWLVIISLSLLLRWRWRRGDELLLQFSGALLLGLGFYCIFVVLNLLHFSMWHQAPTSIMERPVESPNKPDRPRIVWVLFDELSYRQSFGDRFQPLQMPNFDDLRKTSTLFTNVQPIINETEVAIPSILMGQSLDRVDYGSNNQLKVGAHSAPLHNFDSSRTVFALARKNGLSTGVAGWYNPYCNMLAPYVNQCYWTDELQKPSTFAARGLVLNLLQPWVLYARIFAHPRKMLSASYRARAFGDIFQPTALEKLSNLTYRLEIYQDLFSRDIQLLQASGPDFVFLHLPVPHPPGFYDRNTGRFATSGRHSYIDNLALMDKTLGQILAILRQSPRWKNTSVVICSDHSWRVYMWTGASFWTPEDQAASHGGVFDPRPFLMVHLAGQSTPATVNEPFPLLRVHDILDDLVSGKQPTFPSHRLTLSKPETSTHSPQ
jgi:hypothetical protein